MKPAKVPNKDSRFMGLACIQKFFSKDNHTKIGCIIVKDNLILGTGYNGPPAQYNDDELDWSRETKQDHIIHAEINAINHSDRDKLKGATLYVCGIPCKNCAIYIVSAGIKRVVWCKTTDDPDSMLNDPKNIEKTMDIAKRGGVTIEEFKGDLNWLKNAIVELEKLGLFNI